MHVIDSDEPHDPAGAAAADSAIVSGNVRPFADRGGTDTVELSGSSSRQATIDDVFNHVGSTGWLIVKLGFRLRGNDLLILTTLFERPNFRSHHGNEED